MTTSEGTWIQNYGQPLLVALTTRASATWTEGVSDLGTSMGNRFPARGYLDGVGVNRLMSTFRQREVGGSQAAAKLGTRSRVRFVLLLVPSLFLSSPLPHSTRLTYLSISQKNVYRLWS